MVSKIGRKAVLVYPKFTPGTFWGMEGALKKVPRTEFGTPRRGLPPLGLMGLFRELENHYEERVIIDRSIDPRPLEEQVRGNNVDVWMGGMIAQGKGFVEDAYLVKKLGKRLIAGGTFVDEDSEIFKLADHVVINESELALPDLLNGLANKTAKKLYKTDLPDPKLFVRPDFSAINLKNYQEMCIQITRGCPEDCEFCDITSRFGRQPRVTPWEYTEQSLQQLYNLGYRGPIFFVDDNFIGNPRAALDILENIKRIQQKIGWRFHWYSELTLRLADDEDPRKINDVPVMKALRDLIHETNATAQFIGVETPNPKALLETSKKQNLIGNKPIQKKLEYIASETGASTMLGGIFGFDNDTLDLVDPFIDFFNSTSSSLTMIGLLTAGPHTKLWDRLKKEGRLRQSTTGDNTDGTFNFIPNNFSAKEGEEAYVKIQEKVFSSDAYFTRTMRELELINPVEPIHPMNVKDSISSVLKIMTEKHAHTFWKYLPKAHEIALRKGFGTPQYVDILERYFTRCAQFVHFSSQTEKIRSNLKSRIYEPWQLYSWQQLQSSKVTNLEVITEQESTPLKDTVKMKLNNGYEFIGDRLDALNHFVGEHLNEGLRRLREQITKGHPTLDQFLKVEIEAYKRVHLSHPHILGNLNFDHVKEYIENTIRTQSDYLSKMRHLMKYTTANLAPQRIHIE